MNLPAGFRLDGGSAASVKLPNGFVLDDQPSGASGSWEEPDGAIMRGVKGALSQIDPRGILEMITHPVQTVRGLVDTRPQMAEAMEAAAMAIPGGRVEPSVMDPNSRLDYAAHAAKKAISAIPVLGPIAEGITDSITGSIAEKDYAGAAGKAAMNLALARAPKAARAAGEEVSAAGGRMAARQVGEYADSMTPNAPLSESLARQMMDAGVKAPADPALAATRAGNAATRLETEAAALQAARESIPPASAGVADDLARGAQRKSLRTASETAAQEAALQRNIQAVMEALPQEKSVGNILIDGVKSAAKRGGIGGLAGMAIDAIGGGAATAAAVAYTGIETLREITKTRAFQASSAMAKRRFGQAMQSKDLAGAAEVGAQIMSGAFIADEFGHGAAVRALAAETDALPSTELRRQAVAGKTLYYVDPDGRQTQIPRNVMAGFVNAQRLNESESPLNAWLVSMGKQKLIKPGGTIAIQ